MPTITPLTTIAKVQSELPANYSSADLPDADIDAMILEESADWEVRLGATYCRMNAPDHATYPTPEWVQDIVRDGVVAKGLYRLALGDRTTALGVSAEMYSKRCMAAKQALAGHDQIMTGNAGGQVVESQLSQMAETVASETITWGTGGNDWDLERTKAFIPVEAHLDSGDMPQIMQLSVKVLTAGFTGYRPMASWTARGEFFAYFDGTHQRWVFQDLNGSLAAAGATASITYRFEWRRATWRPVPYEEDDEVVFGGAV